MISASQRKPENNQWTWRVGRKAIDRAKESHWYAFVYIGDWPQGEGSPKVFFVPSKIVGKKLRGRWAGVNELDGTQNAGQVDRQKTAHARLDQNSLPYGGYKGGQRHADHVGVGDEILEAELTIEEKNLQDAKRELAEQENTRLGSERNAQRMLDRIEPYQKKVKLHEDNVANLRRELSNIR